METHSELEFLGAVPVRRCRFGGGRGGCVSCGCGSSFSRCSGGWLGGCSGGEPGSRRCAEIYPQDFEFGRYILIFYIAGLAFVGWVGGGDAVDLARSPDQSFITGGCGTADCAHRRLHQIDAGGIYQSAAAAAAGAAPHRSARATHRQDPADGRACRGATRHPCRAQGGAPGKAHLPLRTVQRDV